MTPRPGPRWPRRLIVGFTLLAGLAILFSTWFSHRLMTGVLTGAALSQHMAPPTDPTQLGYRGDPQAAFGYAYQTLAVETPLGPAPAWLVPGAAEATRPDAKLGAIFVHGIGGAREDGYLYLPALHRSGIPVLLISYRQDPDAPMAPEGMHLFGLTEWQDLDAAVEMLRAQGMERVVLVGASMGGAIIGQFLARSDQAPHVVGVILDAPALNFPAVLRHITDRLGLPLRSLGARLAIPAFTLTHGENLGQAVALPAIAAFDGPVLVFQGRADRLVPVTIVQDLLATRQGGTTVLLTPGDHLQSATQDPARVANLIASMIDDLKAAAAP
ncbi:alpha/beta hydrolase [Gemmobacter serpentinus]|uniref:alpha/beta hydrolase n=1 Tax=Gemmobacter serpentinus TaxID=2652247 RepID=UPI00124D5B75|nr:alpha/beta fold hydrolase [Gemmobacter serpentinus]